MDIVLKYAGHKLRILFWPHIVKKSHAHRTKNKKTMSSWCGFANED